ncbi:cytochrome P450 [Nocardia sp. NPDC004068]|uniref:cytochrome P450 family protein n=1 Tax=Nocardia sp. NPDC004068 TaxID=3364303 RepID=UPI003693A2C8
MNEQTVAGRRPVELDAAFLADPYRLYERLRTEAPVCVADIPGGERLWLVTRYDDVRAALTDPAIAKDSDEIMRIARGRGIIDTMGESLRTHMLNSDPPVHTRLRRLVSTVFTPRAVEQLRPRITEIADELVAGLVGRDEADLLAEFAYPLPLTVICELLGVDTADRDDFRRWSAAIVGTTGGFREMRAAAKAMQAYLVSSVARKREQPTDDLLGRLVHARDGDDALSERELVSTAFLLLFAGHETTVNLIASGTLALLRNPEQLAALRADRTLLPAAIEEFLRYESPVNITSTRYTKQATRIGGVDIPAGEFVVVALTSANRDPARFPDPDRVDITRRPTGHVAFGHGMHYCLGAPLARLEAEIAFGRLLDTFDHLALAVDPDELSWRLSAHIRGLSSLPVALRANNTP